MDTFDPLVVKPEKPTVYDPLAIKINQAAIQKSISGMNRTVPLYSKLTGKPVEEVASMYDVDGGASINASAQVMARDSVNISVKQTIDSAATNKEDPDKVLLEIAESFAQVPAWNSIVDPVQMATVLASNSPLAKKTALDKLKKVSIANDVASKALENMSGTANFATGLVSALTPVYSLFSANAKADLSKRANDLMQSNLSEENFAKQFNDLIVEAGDTFDWTRDGNRQMAQEWLSSFTTYNTDGSASWDKALAIVDITLMSPAQIGKVGFGAFKAGQSVAKSGLDIAGLGGTFFKDTKWVQEQLARTVTIDDPTNAPLNVIANTSPSISRTSFAVPNTTSWVSHLAAKEFEETDELSRVLKADIGPSAIEGETFDAYKASYLADKRAIGTKQVVDIDLGMDELGNIYYAEMQGTKSGKPFANKASAEAYSKATNGDEVFEDPTGGFFVIKRANVPLVSGEGNLIEKLKLYSSTNPEELGAGFFAKFGSPMAQTTDRAMGQLVQMAGATKVQQKLASDTIGRVTKSMGKKDINNVAGIFTDMQNGAAYFKGKSYTLTEFEAEYFSKYGKKATDSQKLLYLTTQNMYDNAWKLDADIVFKEEVVKGTLVLKNTGEEFTARKTSLDNVADDDIIWNADINKGVRKSDLPANIELFQPAQGTSVTIKGAEYDLIATTKPNTRRIAHSDVLPRNPGGPRRYIPNEIKFYIKQDDVTILANGKPKAASPNTFMGVRLPAEANAAVQQLNNITSAIKPYLDKMPSKTSKQDLIKALKGMNANSALDSIIASNNAWNHGIGTLDDFLEFAADNGFDIRKEVGYVTDGTPLNVSLGDSFGRFENYGDLFRTANVSKSARRPTPLIGYGGHENLVQSPIETIKQGLMSSIAKRHESQYLASSVNGLIKTTLEKIAQLPSISKIELPEALLKGKTLRGQLAALKKEILNGADPIGAKLLLEAEKIEFRLGSGNFDLASSWTRSTLADFFYGTNTKLGKKLSGAMNMWSTDFSTFARGVAFDTKLGLFAYDQFLVQASGVVNILAIADSKAAFAGAAMYPFIRAALHNGNEKILAETAKRIAPIAGITADEFIELVSILKKSGRTMAGLSAAELGQSSASAVREAGRVFYNEGELVNTITANAVAYLELKKLYPAISPTSKKGLEWIATRQNKLGTGMATVNKSFGQDLPMVQFLTYNFRMAEVMLSGSFGGASRSILTNAEKTKLAVTHLAMYGMSSVPFAGKLMDKIDREYGIPVNDEVYNAFRRGLLDMTLSQILGADTDMASRLAWGEGITNTIYDLMGATVLGAATGPSGAIGTEIISDASNVFTSAITDTTNFLSALKTGEFKGDYTLTMSDLYTLARNIKTVDLTTKIYYATNFGIVFSKNSTNVVSETDMNEAIAIAFGIPLAKLTESYALSTAMYENSKSEKDLAKRVEQLYLRANVLYNSGDIEGAKQLRKEGLVMTSTLDLAARNRVLGQLKPNLFSDLDKTLLKAAQNNISVRNN
jgi:hypothetical protein